MQRIVFLFLAVLSVLTFATGALAGNDEVKFEEDLIMTGSVVEFGKDHMTILISDLPFTVTLGGISNIRSYELPLMMAMFGQKKIGLLTTIAYLPSGKKERRIMQMKFFQPIRKEK